jgi:SnoaL-like polyketide cyclase
MATVLASANRTVSEPAERLIRAHYEDFNQRRLDAAAARFHPDARIEHITGQTEQGADGFRLLAQQWLTAFPDGRLAVECIRASGAGMFDVDLVASGTHSGTLAFGSWVFRPSNVAVRLPARELFHIEDGLFRFASLSFDLHDLVRQLARVDTANLLQHLARIQQTGEQLAADADPARQRDLLDRLGRQLDAARHVLRPYFRGNQ